MKKIVCGVLAHVDSGKTTLSEAMLFCAGAIKKQGRVDRGDSFLDTFSLERRRGITIFSKQAVFSYGGVEFTLIDTPGHVDFSAEAERTLSVLDAAILVVSGADGVQSHTLTIRKLLEKYRVPCFIFVNKTDLAGFDRQAVMSDVKNRLGSGCVDFSAPRGQAFFEELALCDEGLLNEYYDSGSVSDDGIRRAISERKLFPCAFGSALRLKGVDEFLSLLRTYAPAPEYPPDFAGRVFKISQDPSGNRLTFLKVTGGSLRVREILQSPKNPAGEKVSQIRIYSGERFAAVDEAPSGTVCAVTGITFARPGDGLGAESDAVSPLLEQVLNYRLELPAGTDPHAMLEKMRQLEAEDPQLRVSWNERLREIELRLMGDIQLEVLKEVILQRFGVEVQFGQGGVIYKETLAREVEGVGHFEPLRHYAEVHLVMRPGKRGSGIVIRSDCPENKLEKNWQRLILTHLYEKQHIGVLTGSPITDIEITLVSGRAHVKHTEGGDFRQATYRAVRQGLRSGECILLEPIYDFTLDLPAGQVGRALSDIVRMSGSFDPPEQTDAERSVIRGSAPVSEMRGYAREVTQYTHGQGRVSFSLRGYEPCHNAKEVIASVGYDPDADVENPCDSVFCSHGAGHVVKWNEVKDHMHLPAALGTKKEPETASGGRFSKYKNAKDIFALDRELMRIFESTYGPVKSRAISKNDPFRVERRQSEKKYRPPKERDFDGIEYLLIDGYNVIFSWDDLHAAADENVEAARDALVNILCNYRGFRECEIILVFDAYKVKGGVGSVEKVDNITVVYTKEAETADTYIEKASYDLAKKHRVRVVTSDAQEQLIIFGNGALRVPSGEFLAEVRAVEDEIREIISNEL
ncbi:MAG: TetM/TetW/TetO/TetS family tetracycline resistance ribosomal protection protein [Clostridia bacterium]|nr:TetM/TetW/TetO/TetS family tetracycline resistance ribosomal protection protein [Clostridia bacterium]